MEQVEPNAPSGQGGRGKPMAIGSGDVERLFCDGQGLCSPGLWVPEDRVHPSAPAWLELSRLFLYTTETLGTIQACVRACIGRSPFHPAVVERLRQDTVAVLQRNLVELVREEQGISELPIDFPSPGSSAAGALSSLAKGRMPRCPKLCTKKKTEEADP